MRARRDDFDFDNCEVIAPPYVEALKAGGCTMRQIFQPSLIRQTRGTIASDGRFDPDPEGDEHMVFQEPNDDWVFWHFESGRLGSWRGAFALGMAVLSNPGVCALDGCLAIVANAQTWVHFRERAVVVLSWSRAWQNLSHYPRIAVTPELIPVYLLHMQPPTPELSVIPLFDPLPTHGAPL